MGLWSCTDRFECESDNLPHELHTAFGLSRGELLADSAELLCMSFRGIFPREADSSSVRSTRYMDPKSGIYTGYRSQASDISYILVLNSWFATKSCNRQTFVVLCLYSMLFFQRRGVKQHQHSTFSSPSLCISILLHFHVDNLSWECSLITFCPVCFLSVLAASKYLSI